jgi:hypothetical protein
VEYVLASDPKQAVSLLEANDPLSSEDIDVVEVTECGNLAEELETSLPICDEELNPDILSCEEILCSLISTLEVRSALESPSDFPIVPELELSPAELQHFLWKLVSEPKSTDWNVKGYLFLRFPKLRDAILSLQKDLKDNFDELLAEDGLT